MILGGVDMEIARVPLECVKAANDLEPEANYAARSLKCTTRKATAADIARIEAEIAAKTKPITVDICGELRISRKLEKTPEIPFEEMAVKSRLAKIVKFERVAG